MWPVYCDKLHTVIKIIDYKPYLRSSGKGRYKRKIVHTADVANFELLMC